MITSPVEKSRCPPAIAATAHRTEAGFRLNAEKWFVTAGDVASVYLVVANVVD